MRAVNVLIAVLLSLGLALCVPELGLRLLGRGPAPSLHRFDAELGWVKEPGREITRSTAEFKVTFRINEHGLRDDEGLPLEPVKDRLRVLMLGDSFVLGYTVEREHLFVDQLERWWQAEGRAIDVINAGTEGWSTDQEALWFEREGTRFRPDLVLLFPYENDLYWCSERKYTRFPKPQVSPDGKPVRIALKDPGERAWWERTALGALFSGAGTQPKRFSPAEGVELPMEYGALMREEPEFMRVARAHAGGALTLLQQSCARIGARLIVAPIPGKAAIQPEALAKLERSMGIPPERFSPDQPVETFLALAQERGIETMDARANLRAAFRRDSAPLYYETDWHFNPHGNAQFARFLHAELDARGAFPAGFRATTPRDLPEPQAPGTWPRWPFAWAALVLLIGTLYARSYREEPVWRAYLQVGLMLGLVFALFFGAQALLALLPPRLAPVLLVLGIGLVLGFVLWEVGRRLGTTLELLLAFTRRGHWYLLPLVILLLSIGSLLVVAASSPLVAPFIYTLF